MLKCSFYSDESFESWGDGREINRCGGGRPKGWNKLAHGFLSLQLAPVILHSKLLPGVGRRSFQTSPTAQYQISPGEPKAARTRGKVNELNHVLLSWWACSPHFSNRPGELLNVCSIGALNDINQYKALDANFPDQTILLNFISAAISWINYNEWSEGKR